MPPLRPQRRGHTLVELAIAIAIVGIVAALGLSAGREQLSRYRLMSSARKLHADLVSLKSEAIGTQREMRILFVEADEALDPGAPQVGAWTLQAGNRSSNSTAWDTLPIDTNGEPDDSQGQRDLADGGPTEAAGISLAAWPALDGPGTQNADAIVFSPRGFVVNPATDFVDGYIRLELVNKDAAQHGADERATIKLSRGGMARLETGASSTLPEGGVGTAQASTP